MTGTCGGTISGNCARGIAAMREEAGDRDDDRDDEGHPRPVDEDGGNHIGEPLMGAKCCRAAARAAAAP